MWTLIETVQIDACRVVALLEGQDQVYGEVLRYFRNLMTAEVRQLNSWDEWTPEMGAGAFYVRSGDIYELRMATLGYVYNGMDVMSVVKSAEYKPPPEDDWVSQIERARA